MSGATSCSRCGPTTVSRASSATCAPRSARRSSVQPDSASSSQHLRRRHGARRRRLDDRRHAPALPRGDRALARRHLRGRRVRRLRPGRQPRHPRARRGHGRAASDLVVDFAGSDDRPDINAWSTFGNTRGYTIAQLASLVDPTIPKNEGFFDCIDLRVPEGTCVNPVEGKPVSAGTHHPGVEVGDAIAIAMSQIIPDRCAPQTYKYGAPRQMWGDVDPRTGKSFFDHGGEVNAGWVNAVQGVDGWGALVASNGNLIKASAEINETLFPHILRGRNYLTDSGGAGEWRGGCGQLLREGGAHTDAREPVRREPASTPTPGSPGAHAGSPDSCVHQRGNRPRARASRRRSPRHRWRPVTGSSTASAVAAGGATRSTAIPQAVLDDVWDEYVSIEAARERLRRRHHRLGRRHDSRPRPRRHRRTAHGTAGRRVSERARAGCRLAVSEARR